MNYRNKMHGLFKIFNNKYIILLFILLVILSFRIPFLLNDISFNNDASTYSENFEKKFFDGTYNVQPPGYVSYIYLGRIINIFTDNSVLSQHVINIAVIIIIAVLFYYLLALFNIKPVNRLFFTLFLMLNNVLLLGSLTGGNRMFLILASVVLMIVSYKIIIEEKIYYVILFAFSFAFIAGFRQDIIFYFLPLYLFNLYISKNFKFIILSVVVFIFVYLCWFIPLIIEYGGINSYITLVKTYKASYHTSLIISGFRLSPILNIFRVLLYTAFSIICFMPLIIYNIIFKKINIDRNIFLILLFTFIPPFLFQLFVHNGNYVHIACFITPLIIFLLINFDIDKKSKLFFSIIICIFLIFQFYGLKMFNDDIPLKISKHEFENKILVNIKNNDDKIFLNNKYLLNGQYYETNLNDSSKDDKNKMKDILYSANYKFFERTINVLLLQFTYDGAKKGRTYRLKSLKKEYGNEND